MATFFARAAWRSRISAGLCICVGGALLLPGMQAAKAVWETGRSAADVLHEPKWPPAFPLDAKDMSRLDETSDALFYSQPRFVQHIDEYAVKTLNRHYREVRAHCERQRLRNPERARCFTFHLQVLPKGGAVLDLMSSWTSHLATGAGAEKSDGWFARLSAVGMNEAELARNPGLHDYHVADLNEKPSLAMYADNSFDAVFCSVSVDYLSQPLVVFSEIRRVLRPGGLVVFTWSNRMFPTKAINAWRLASEPARLWICGAYIHYTGGFSAPEGVDLSPYPGRTDPVYAVSARKLPAGKEEL